MIIDVVVDCATALAGASPGMSLIAVNGKRFTTEVLDASIAEAHTTRKPIAFLVESSDYFRTLSVGYHDGPRYPHLVRLEDRPDTLTKVISSRAK